MDPVANLKEQLELARDLIDGSAHDKLAASERLAELVLALDEWRRKGGYDPYTV